MNLLLLLFVQTCARLGRFEVAPSFRSSQRRPVRADNFGETDPVLRREKSSGRERPVAFARRARLVPGIPTHRAQQFWQHLRALVVVVTVVYVVYVVVC